MIKAFLLVKVTLTKMDNKITKVFNQFTKLLQHFLVLQAQSQNGNLRDCQMKNLSLFIQLIKVFLQNWYG